MRFIRPVLGALLAALLAHAIPTQSCARYFPDSNPATGTGRNVPFGSPTMQSLTSLFNANNGGSSGGAVYFDLKAHNQRLYLHALGINTNAPIGTELIADVYSFHHSHVGREATPSLWRARAMARGTAAGLNNPSTLEFDRSILVQPVSGTTVGIAVVARNFAHRYTDGANTYSDANVTWTLGAASNAPFTSPIIAPRTANMSLHYQLATTLRHNQMYQAILRSADLGGPGSITGLAFAPMQTGKHYMRDLQIRLAHKPPGYNLSLEFYANLAPAWWSATTVLAETDYTWHLTRDQWNGVGFSLPFDYDGVSDVIVQIATRDNHMESGAPAWFHSSPVQERLYATGFEFWRPPPVWHGTHSHSSGLKMRVDFGCGESGEFGTSCGPARAEASAGRIPARTTGSTSATLRPARARFSSWGRPSIPRTCRTTDSRTVERGPMESPRSTRSRHRRDSRGTK